MVAIKPAHKQLTMRDLWPDAAWDWGDEHKIRKKLRQELIDSGMSDPTELYFAEARAWERYLQAMPRYGDKQKILKKIYPPKAVVRDGQLTKDELDYMIQKLHGVNDDLGYSLKEKLERMMK